jgi:hypothetical protein
VALLSFLFTIMSTPQLGFAKPTEGSNPKNKLLAARNDFDDKSLNDHMLFIEFKDPLEYCERFLKKDKKEGCKDLISSKKPDWYFASYCDRIFDDDLFIDCMKKAQVTMVEPRHLRRCENPRTDSGIRDCLWRLDAESRGELKSGKSLNRLPASGDKDNHDPFYKPMKLKGSK